MFYHRELSATIEEVYSFPERTQLLSKDAQRAARASHPADLGHVVMCEMLSPLQGRTISLGDRQVHPGKPLARENTMCHGAAEGWEEKPP